MQRDDLAFQEKMQNEEDDKSSGFNSTLRRNKLLGDDSGTRRRIFRNQTHGLDVTEVDARTLLNKKQNQWFWSDPELETDDWGLEDIEAEEEGEREGSVKGQGVEAKDDTMID